VNGPTLHKRLRKRLTPWQFGWNPEGRQPMIRLAAAMRRTLLPAACISVGLVAGALGLYLLTAAPSEPLQLWHTVTLREEFTADQAAEIRSFEDYRRLEDRLFEELQEQVYAHVQTGPANALVRYSAGSAADPSRHDPAWNRSFELPATPASGAVLLLHGMSDSPYSLRALGEDLQRQGYWVLGLRMPGHGTVPSGMKTVTREDMAAVVRLGVSHLAAHVQPPAGSQQPAVHIVGYSTGAPLALD
jgi:predicted alpha/beta-fold hydrolase